MMVKFGALSPLGWLGWIIVAAVWVWLFRAIRRGPFQQDYATKRPASSGEPNADIFADLQARYARGEVSPEEYPEELARVPGAMGLYDPFKRD